MKGGPRSRRTEPQASSGTTNPFVRASILNPMLRALQDHGLDGGVFLRDCNIDIAALRDPYVAVPLKDYVAAMEKAAMRLHDPLFGARLGQRISPQFLGPIGVLFASAATARDALSNMGRFLSAWQGATKQEVLPNGPVSHITYMLADETIRPRRQDAEFSLVALCALMRMRLGPAWAPLGYAFEHPERGLGRQFRALTAAPVLYGRAENWISVLSTDLDKPSPERPDPVSLLETQLHDLVGDMNEATSTVDDVRLVIGQGVGRRTLTLQSVAKDLRLSPRTLQRRLSAAGTNFRIMLAAERQLIGTRLIESFNLSLDTVAGRLGYSDATVLSRARRRWNEHASRPKRT